MRLRPLVALSVAAVSAVLLAGCSGAGEAPEPTGTPAAATDLCSAAAPSGAASDAIKVSGDVGAVPKVEFATPIETSDPALQRTVNIEGDGTKLAPGDFVDYAATILNGSTGEVLSQLGYASGEVLPQQVSPQGGGAIFGCATVGSRISVANFTGDATTPSVVYVIDVLGIAPTEAWGDPQAPVEGMPSVALADNGAPTITIPSTDPLTETKVVDLKKGDGATVESGDQVLVQYTGVRWSNGETFDSTWDKGGVPATFATDKVVVGFQKALEGQKVGSQVLVVMTPEDGYGAGEINTTDLKGETLVFVVDILGAAHAQAAPGQ